jgi:NADH-quinone oxidoreductase subunit N
VLLSDPQWLPQLLADLKLVMPELWLVVTMCLVLVTPFIRKGNVILPVFVSIFGLMMALLAAQGVHLDSIEDVRQGLVFSNCLAIDPFSSMFKTLLMVFAMLIVVQWTIFGREKTHALDAPDFLCLLLGATFGMSLMSSANNLIMIFIATESASIPSYALAGFRKKSKLATEGSLKYVLFGSVSSALMLYGMSLLYGVSGSLQLSHIAGSINAQGMTPLMVVGLVGMFAGFAFKLSAVPMHFWCPDVFEGAPTEVTTFLSVASKGAAICMLARVVQNFGTIVYVEEIHVGIALGIGALGAVTATWGNLVALHQTNLKRLLAYSSISHAGYMIMGCAVLLLVDPKLILSALLFYVLVYMFMNLGAFTVAAVLERQLGTLDIADYAGLFKKSPLLASLLIIFMLSLFGMPGLGGFMGKFMLGAGMIKAGTMGTVLVGILLLNTVFSLWYYLRPAYFMIFVNEPQDKQLPVIQPLRPAIWAILGVCCAMLFWTGLLPAIGTDITRDNGRMIVSSAHRSDLQASEHTSNVKEPIAKADAH